MTEATDTADPAGPRDWRSADVEGRAVVPWRGLRVCIVGARVVGISAAHAVRALGAEVTLVDRGDDATTSERVAPLYAEGVRVRLGDDATLPDGCELLVVSPGIPPRAPIVAAARKAGIPVWGDVELAWRLRKPLPDGSYAPWLPITGTNGKTTAVRMLAAMLGAAGKRTVACGNIGLPILDAVLAQDPYDVLAIELSSFQLHWTESMSPLASAVLNVAPDHIDWHGSLGDYTRAKGRIYENCQVACVYNVADDVTRELVEDAEVVEGCRAIGFTLGAPGLSMLGVVDGILADRAFVEDRQRTAAELGTIYDVEPHAPHNIANALAAGALARAYGVPPAAVRDGLRAFRPDPHRIAFVASIDGVDFVDDSKATNPHAAAASLAAYEDVVWIAGGLAKGATFDDLVAGAARRLRGAVLLGADRSLIARALARHAPDVPVVDIGGAQDGLTGARAIERAVEAASRLAAGKAAALGDAAADTAPVTVLLAPACASMDLFVSYGERGDLFARAVRERKAARG
ncbi:UDP-N-acetylmuramoyl-L-alanine--D-glutamate ligase [Actinocrinis puniceicyclus]|uniref:UDP-N-acetylmuramoylalanine--D-glutamate ligase n=1 Tax=Actinocrinis puniceicyclus TaxID=977794 RepID=A0A8J8BCE2_9ACTN|nr:UDP-N-acetylmuramoyl-L-alanine--D-glutamate ligase [Actinocrinis puniceicyclus]MBS2964058.1 UDP-N-acetylmuramoyl-L-alanine--D-glutamate ligase [Actinocrinis puniceicyclus]